MPRRRSLLLALPLLLGTTGGSVQAKVASRTDGQGWSLTGEITAEPAIPGVSGSLTGRYGVFPPLHAEGDRGRPADFSFDRMRFEYPSIDAAGLARGVPRPLIDT
ncbi:hypothetical protein [Streptomyces sp. NRRL S-337]|uniref:hypothetical protein n=1 Tax=Streptomyces sp. NRRL S-337 TaxID=1463900 RepID=UPI0004C87F07|nr:hypothetical protein [Streptomyces sp. NRRL S-337]